MDSSSASNWEVTDSKNGMPLSLPGNQSYIQLGLILNCARFQWTSEARLQRGCITLPKESQVMESFHRNGKKHTNLGVLNFISKSTTGTVLTRL